MVCEMLFDYKTNVSKNLNINILSRQTDQVSKSKEKYELAKRSLAFVVINNPILRKLF